MQYQVPQFIEVEDKIIGPLSFKQFVYLAGGAGLSFVLYISSLPFLIALPLIAIAIGLALAFAFYRVNNKSFADFIEAALKYAVGSRLYIWKKEQKKPEAAHKEEKVTDLLYVPRLSESKLRDIAWSLDVHPEEQNTPPQVPDLQV